MATRKPNDPLVRMVQLLLEGAYAAGALLRAGLLADDPIAGNIRPPRPLRGPCPRSRAAGQVAWPPSVAAHAVISADLIPDAATKVYSISEPM
jgi:hypothetical protein